MTPRDADPRFFVLSEALASYASDPDDPPVQDDERVQAAVALVLRGAHPLELLLIKRARSPRDPWSGHMALPGGRRDPVDGTLVRTALRETHEETGLALEEARSLLGPLDPVSPSSARLPRLTVFPFVFGALPDAQARVASTEVADVFWVSLDQLRDPATHDTVPIELPGGSRSFPCYRVGREIVWGLTYRILRQFLERYPTHRLPSER